MDDDVLPLEVTVAAEEWSRLNMRVRYLEAALVQAYRGQRQLREWFSASDLLALQLPTVPTSRRGLLRRAHMEHWETRTVEGRGGERFEFHFSSLPRHAFAELIRRIIAPPEHQAQERQEPGSGIARQSASMLPPRVLPENASPPWLLPLMRLLRSDAHMSPEEACRRLSASLPPSVPLPTPEDVRNALQRLR